VIVVDTGPLVALADTDDKHHQACRDWFVTADRLDLIVPAPVIAEACYLIGRYCGPPVEAAFLADLGRGAYGMVSPVFSEDLARMSHLVTQYADLPLGGTDACVVATAERLGASQIATIDRRHFTIVRPAHVKAFTLLPE
jgi:predicted nucleic acid-binding protein